MNKNFLAFLSTSLVVFLSACGGSSGDSGGFFGGSLSYVTTNVPVTVIDGPLQYATVCLDKNLNGACDMGEPAGSTDANGLANLRVDNADVAKFPLIAIVDVNAVDRDTGPVKTRYVLKAPADAASVISPLTTLVQLQVETFAQTTAQATASVASATGISPAQLTADYTKDTSAAGSYAYAIAQAVVVAAQKQGAAIQSAVGRSAIDGSAITQANIDRAAASASAKMLSAIVSNIANSNAVTNAATPQSRLAALQNLISTDFLKNSGGLTSVGGAQVAVGIQTASATQASSALSTYSASATANLANLQFTDANHWSARISQKSLTEATLDSNNTYRYRWGHYKNDGGGPVAWGGTGGTPAGGTALHWNGSAWVNCVINHQNTSTAPDADGISKYNYCDKLSTGITNSKAPTSASFDIGGQSMSSVYIDKIAAANFTNIKLGDGTVGSVTALLGTVLFPSGSKITYTTDISDSTAVVFYPSSGIPNYDETVILPSPEDSLGGDFTSGATQTACLSSTASNTPATKLVDLIARKVGSPCKYAPATVLGFNGVLLSSTEGGQTRNETWGLTTLGMGTLGAANVPGTAAAATSYYTGNTSLRLAFAANSVVNFYGCKQRFDGVVMNCDLLTSGKYNINSLSDGSRTLTFTGFPPIAAGLGWQRVFVERNRLVYWAYQDLPRTDISARLNKVALDALFKQLGLNTVSYFKGADGGFDPASTITLNPLAYAGFYMGSVLADGYTSGDLRITVGANGSNTCSGTRPYTASATSGAPFTCTVVVTPSSSDSTSAKIEINMNGTLAVGSLNYYTGVISGGTWSDKGLTPSSGTFTGSRL